jgi:hypothetical protein
MRIVGRTEDFDGMAAMTRNLCHQRSCLASAEKENLHWGTEQFLGLSKYLWIQIRKEDFMKAPDHLRDLVFLDDECQIDLRCAL